MNGATGEVIGKGKTVTGLGILTISTWFSQRAMAHGVEGLTPEVLMAFGGQVIGAITTLYGLVMKIVRSKEDKETEIWRAINKMRSDIAPPRA